MAKEIQEYQLIRQYLKGDEKAFSVLLEHYMTPIYRFVFTYVNNAETAEDITQEVFLKVWRNLKKMDETKNFKSWIYTVAKNTALDFLKKKKSIPFSRFEQEDGTNVLMNTISDDAILPDKAAELLFNRAEVYNIVNKLSEKYRLVLTLYYYKYLNFREIADFLKEPISTIKSRHRRGLAMLKKLIGRETPMEYIKI